MSEPTTKRTCCGSPLAFSPGAAYPVPQHLQTFPTLQEAVLAAEEMGWWFRPAAYEKAGLRYAFGFNEEAALVEWFVPANPANGNVGRTWPEVSRDDLLGPWQIVDPEKLRNKTDG